MTESPFLRRPPLVPSVVIALGTGLGVSAFAVAWLFVVKPPLGWWHDHPFAADLSWLIGSFDACIRNAAHQKGGFPLAAVLGAPSAGVRACAAMFGLGEPLVERLTSIGVSGGAAGLVAMAYHQLRAAPADGLTHLAGRRLFTGDDAIRQANRANRASIRSSGQGLWIAPYLHWSREQETAHLLLLGTTGAGKTAILRFLVEQIVRRGDKLVVHDSKGDMTAGFPGDAFVLLAPHDQRSWAWDIARDCSSKQDARELAARMIAESKDPMWAQAARAVLSGLIITLQATSGKAWTWRDLYGAVFQPAAEIKAQLDAHAPDASRYIELDAETGGPTKTSFGFLVNLWACVAATIGPLAEAWGDAPAERRFSLRGWMLNDSSNVRTVVLQRDPTFPELSAAWIGSATQVLAATGASAAMTESRERRVWLAVDEFDQLGRLPSFAQLLAVGRSKGVCCILGVQDLDQISGTYGEPVMRAWLNMLGTKIIGRMPSGPSANFISEQLVGRRKVAWVETQVTHSSGGSSVAQRTTARHHRHEEVPVIYSSTLESDLGRKGNRIVALMLGLGDVFQLTWPLIIWPEYRPATSAAEWTKS